MQRSINKQKNNKIKNKRQKNHCAFKIHLKTKRNERPQCKHQRHKHHKEKDNTITINNASFVNIKKNKRKL